MLAEIFANFGQMGTLIIGSFGILVALRNQHRQLNIQMFIEFSGRFQGLLRLFPTEAWLANRNPSQPLPPPSQELTDCTLYTMQFVADIYYLHQGGYISKSLWTLYEREIVNTLTGPLFRREWLGVSVEFAHNDNFVPVHRHANARRTPSALNGSLSRAIAVLCDPSADEFSPGSTGAV